MAKMFSPDDIPLMSGAIFWVHKDDGETEYKFMISPLAAKRRYNKAEGLYPHNTGYGWQILGDEERRYGFMVW